MLLGGFLLQYFLPTENVHYDSQNAYFDDKSLGQGTFFTDSASSEKIETTITKIEKNNLDSRTDKKVDNPVQKLEKIESTKNNIKSGEPKLITQSPKKSVYVQAEPLVGYDSLYSYFNNNLRYPEVDS